MAIRKSFLHQFGGMVSFGGTIGNTSEQSAKVFSIKILFSIPIYESFLLRKFPTIHDK